MATQQQPTTIENLPAGVLSEILIRLPAKPLARMRSVSKPWNALLSHPSFIKSHLRRSILNNDEIILVLNDRFMSKPELFPLTDPNFELANFIKLPDCPQFERTDLSICRNFFGSVDGLLCISYRLHNDHVIQIWNPSLSAVLTLPPYVMPSFSGSRIRISMRFGFDPITDDYKVVKIMSRCELPPSLAQCEFFLGLDSYVVKEWLQVEVYSMRKGFWELITQTFPSRVTDIYELNEVFVDSHDGHLYWLGCIEENRKVVQTIVAFDLGVNMFSEICLPDSLVRWNGMGVFGGKLYVMSSVKGSECEVWVMNEYGVAESWVKKHVFSLGDDDIFPFGITLNNKFLCLSKRNLVLFDRISGELKSSEEMNSLIPRIKVVGYVDSLVWVSPAN